jgi:hypothetical protein
MAYPTAKIALPIIFLGLAANSVTRTNCCLIKTYVRSLAGHRSCEDRELRLQ